MKKFSNFPVQIVKIGKWGFCVFIWEFLKLLPNLKFFYKNSIKVNFKVPLKFPESCLKYPKWGFYQEFVKIVANN